MDKCLVTEEGVTLLGAPLGSHRFEFHQIQKKVDKIKAITDLLPLLEDSQTEFVLLRSCLSLPKISFLMRAVDTCSHTALLQEFDQVTREALIRILGAPVSDRVWQQSKLPVSMGGLGLRAAEDHASAALLPLFSLLSCESKILWEEDRWLMVKRVPSLKSCCELCAWLKVNKKS